MGLPGSGSGRVRRGVRAMSSLRSWGRNGGGLWPRLVRREPIAVQGGPGVIPEYHLKFEACQEFSCWVCLFPRSRRISAKIMRKVCQTC